jgi:TolA-binding protein
MKKLGLLALPLVAIIAIAGLASAYPLWNVEDMTQEEKDVRVQVLELQQEMLQNQIAYLKGELTEEQFQEMLQGHFDEMQSLREQLREHIHLRNPDAMGCRGRGFKGFGRGMRGMGF